MKIFGLIGWKNSGKTYFAQQIIQQLSSQNLRVASIKHAHHNFDIDQPNTDSFLHRQSGSQQVIISSSKRWAKMVELKDAPEKKLEDLILTYKNFPKKGIDFNNWFKGNLEGIDTKDIN